MKYAPTKKWSVLLQMHEKDSRYIYISSFEMNRAINILFREGKKIPAGGYYELTKILNNRVYIELKRRPATSLSSYDTIELFSIEEEKINNLAKKLGLPLKQKELVLKK